MRVKEVYTPVCYAQTVFWRHLNLCEAHTRNNEPQYLNHAFSTRRRHGMRAMLCVKIHSVVSRLIASAVSTFSLWGLCVAHTALILREDILTGCYTSKRTPLSCVWSWSSLHSVVRHYRGNHAFCTVCRSSIILPGQSISLFVLWPKATDCIRGSRDRKRGLFVPALNSHYIHSPH